MSRFHRAVEGDLEFCPVGSPREPDTHCSHWYDGGSCCRCNALPIVQIEPVFVPGVFGLGYEVTAAIRLSRQLPLNVVCPQCLAAVSAKCTEPKRAGMGGFQFVNWFHQERIVAAERTVA